MSQLSEWPGLLPHYRFVKPLPKTNQSKPGWSGLHMSAKGGLFPVSWKAVFRANATALELEFEHVAAFTKGMRVIWKLIPNAGGTRVEIHHDLSFRIYGLGFLFEPILQHGFIEPVAQRTLKTFKQLLEAK